jgi:hypothetical protein
MPDGWRPSSQQPQPPKPNPQVKYSSMPQQPHTSVKSWSQPYDRPLPQEHCPSAVHVASPSQVPHEVPHPSLPQILPSQLPVHGGGVPVPSLVGGTVVVGTVPFFFFFFFFFFLASVGRAPRVRRPPRLEPASRRSAVRRDGDVNKERRRVSKRSASIASHLGNCRQSEGGSMVMREKKRVYPQYWGYGHRTPDTVRCPVSVPAPLVPPIADRQRRRLPIPILDAASLMGVQGSIKAAAAPPAPPGPRPAPAASPVAPLPPHAHRARRLPWAALARPMARSMRDREVIGDGVRACANSDSEVGAAAGVRRRTR